MRNLPIKAFADISGGRLEATKYDNNFADIKPPLTTLQAQVESARCLFCYDAPCITACQTGIDIPGFIRGINTGNIDGAANTILSSNILGASCARICPVEILCEQACVRSHEQDISLSELRRKYDAVFIAAGLQAVNHLNIEGEGCDAARNAVDYIAELRQSDDLAKLPVGRRVVVIGAGNTAVDIATQSRQLDKHLFPNHLRMGKP